MRRPCLLTLATVLVTGVAAPAVAQLIGPEWDRIATVDFSFRPTVDVRYGRFGGSVEALALQARDSDATCRTVTATFANGQTREIFRGFLPRARNVVVDLPGRERFVRQIAFNCRSLARSGTRVDIAADIGRYRAEWRRSPEWTTVWSRIFRWDDVAPPTVTYAAPPTYVAPPTVTYSSPPTARYAPPPTGRYVTGDLDTAGWITLGSENFEGRFDHEMTFAGWRGRSVDAIALRPLNDDARCSNVMVTFANGSTRTLDIDEGDVLPMNRITTLDLPGAQREVMRVDMNCHSERGGPMTMQVLASG